MMFLASLRGPWGSGEKGGKGGIAAMPDGTRKSVQKCRCKKGNPRRGSAVRQQLPSRSDVAVVAAILVARSPPTCDHATSTDDRWS